jgi:hypothetical protein
MLPIKQRICTKSKWFSGNVHSSCASSSSNLTFGGTHEGCIGERSVPMTVAEGNSSAKSLGGKVSKRNSQIARPDCYIAQLPVPVPISRTF